MRDKEQEIIVCFDGDYTLTLTKQQIIDKAKIVYWSNTNKYVGERLKRLINSKKIVKLSHNRYRLAQSKDFENHNQLDLFST